MVIVDSPWADVVFVLGVLLLGAALIAIVIWQIFATARAKMSVAREAAYRKLAEEATQAQVSTAVAMDKALAELTEIRRRTAEMERMLKEVG
ncbi:MAG: hypothetical protein WD208_12735 [Dehalococcoidia bacterium]